MERTLQAVLDSVIMVAERLVTLLLVFTSSVTSCDLASIAAVVLLTLNTKLRLWGAIYLNNSVY